MGTILSLGMEYHLIHHLHPRIPLFQTGLVQAPDHEDALFNGVTVTVHVVPSRRQTGETSIESRAARQRPPRALFGHRGQGRVGRDEAGLDHGVQDQPGAFVRAAGVARRVIA